MKKSTNVIYTITQLIKDIKSNKEILLDQTEVFKLEKLSNQKHYNYKESQFIDYINYIITNITVNKTRLNTELMAKSLKVTKYKIALFYYLANRNNYITTTSGKDRTSRTYDITNEYKQYQIIEINTTFRTPDLVSIKGEEKDLLNLLEQYSLDMKDMPESFRKSKREVYYKSSLPNMIESIKNNDLKYILTESNGRRDSIISTLKKEFRQYITINNEEITNIDICNAQPVFIANKYKDIVDENFYNDCINNTFYDELGKLFKGDREKGKKYWMYIAYNSIQAYIYDGEEAYINGQGKNTNTAHIKFYEKYPKTALLLDQLKEKHGNNIANYITSLESKYTNTISDLLFDNNIQNLTNRDEILLPVSQYDKAMKLIKKFNKENGLTVPFKTAK